MFETTMVGKADEIFSQFPKSTELLKGWVKKNLVKLYTKMNGGGAPVEIVEHIILMGMKSTIEVLPRNLYEFFDENEVAIEIYGSWKHGFKIGVDNIEFDAEYNGRQEAEKEAFLIAFKILEEKL